MKSKYLFVTVGLLLVALTLSACFPGLPVSGVDSQGQAATQEAIIMQAVQATSTTIAMQTQISQLETQVAQASTPQAQQPSAAAQPSATSEPVFTATPAQPTATSTPEPPTSTPTDTPTATVEVPVATATRTATPIPCNLAQFVSDVTVQDGATFVPGATFTKTWRLKNIGACTWTTDYDIVFVDGNQMSAPSAVNMPGNVSKGQVIDVSVNMKAPSNTGSYRSNWMIRDASGILFGVGVSGAPFYADIRVSESSSSSLLNFVDRMCEASWSNADGGLPCPGENNDADGFVRRIDNPTLESGYVDDEPVLQMFPQMINNGQIRGKYPAVRVKNGQHFVATIGCAYKATDCDVTFRLAYQIGSDSWKTLKNWHEVYDKKFISVDVDLSSLAGKDVKFILIILANGSSKDDRAQWLAPRIIQK